jgi:hypothetical protein
MQRCDNSNSGEDSDDNSESSDDEENTSIRFNGRDGSDNGSGTQVYSDFFFWTCRLFQKHHSGLVFPPTSIENMKSYS